MAINELNKKGIQKPVIYLMNIAEAENITELYCKEHFPERYAKALKFRFKEDQYRCICAGVLLHKILGLKEEDIYYNEYGKPLADSVPYFSISHSGEYVTLAVSSKLIGVDIEMVKNNSLNLKNKIFTDEESLWVGDNLVRFFTLWTLKESLSKAVGTGLSVDMKKMPALKLLSGKKVLYSGKEWFAHSIPMDNEHYILSLVHETDENPDIVQISV